MSASSGSRTKGKRLVIHFDEARGFFGDVAIDGGNGCYGVAREANRVGEDVTLVARIAAAPDDVAVFAGDDLLDAGERQCFRNVHAADVGMRMRAAQDSRVEHAGEMDVAGVSGGAGDALAGVDARRCVAHGLERVHALVLPVAVDAASTAST